jgi:hypothetical protein
MPPEEFDRRLHFHASLKSLNRLIQEERSIESVANRVVLFPATVRTVVIHQPDPDEYYAEVELVTGEWEGVKSVALYRAYLVLIGRFFVNMVAEQPPENPDSGVIYEGRRVLVAGQVAQVGPDDAGNLVPIIVAYDMRVLD